MHTIQLFVAIDDQANVTVVCAGDDNSETASLDGVIAEHIAGGEPGAFEAIRSFCIEVDVALPRSSTVKVTIPGEDTTIAITKP